jgi:hypothetical protein
LALRYALEQHRHSGTVIRRQIGIPPHGNRRANGAYPNTSNNAQAFSVIEQ